MSKDKKIDILFHMCLVLMVGTLSLFLDPELKYTWREASLISSKAQGQGVNHTQCIHEWILGYLQYNELPFHHLGQARWTALEGEDITQEIKMKLTEQVSRCYIKVSDVVDVVASPELQVVLRQKGICKPSISECTVQRWLAGLGWQYGKTKNGMYIDGHKCKDVVEYKCGFVSWWKEYECRFHKWDNNGKELEQPDRFPVPGRCFWLIPVTHDKSRFYQNDQCMTMWAHKSDKATPKPKGDGQSIMVSDFLTPEWHCLCDDDA